MLIKYWPEQSIANTNTLFEIMPELRLFTSTWKPESVSYDGAYDSTAKPRNWCHVHAVADPGGANPAMPPIEIRNGVWPPPAGQKEQWKYCDYVEKQGVWPPYRCRLRIWPPHGTIPYIKHEKGRWLKKRGHQKFLEIDGMQKFFRESPKKGRWKMLAQIWPPSFWSPGSASAYMYLQYFATVSCTDTRCISRLRPPLLRAQFYTFQNALLSSVPWKRVTTLVKHALLGLVQFLYR